MRNMFSEIDPKKPAFHHVFAYMGGIRTEDRDEPFRAVDHIKAYSGIWGSTCSMFQWCFLKDGGKVEEPSEGVLYHSYGVKDRALWNQYTLDLLGGEAEVEITLSGVVSVVEQANSNPAIQEKIFKTNGWSNYFYVRDRIEILRRLFVHKEKGRYRLFVAQNLFSDTSTVKPIPGDRFFSKLDRAWS